MIKSENILITIYGLLTVGVFLILIIYGGLFDSIHTFLYREVSFLISPYALKEEVTVPLYRIYNINLLMFALVLFLRMRNAFAKLGALYLAISAVMGVLLLQFPMDPFRLSESDTGFFHIVVSSLIGFYIIIALLLFSYGFRKNKHFLFFSRFSFEISMLMLLGGFLTGFFALQNMPVYVGIFQKLPILAFLLWVVVTAFWIMRSDKRVSYAFFRKHRRKR